MSTARESILKTLRREGYDKIPVDFVMCRSQRDRFFERYGHRDYQAFLGMPHRWVELEARKSFSDFEKLYSREILPEQTEIDELGVGHSKGSEQAFHMTRMHHPLKGATSRNEFIDYPYPTVRDEDNQALFNEIKSFHKEGLAVIAMSQMTIFEASWYIRSMDELMMDMMMESELATILLDRITEYACERARLYARAGCDIISLGDDIGMQEGPLMAIDLWRRWIKPRLSRVIDSAREIKPDVLIFYHSCGDATLFINDLIEAGIDIMNPIQPECMDFNSIHKEFGNRLSFWGTLGTQQLVPFGTPDDIKSVIEERIQICGDQGGIVIGPTHMVEPEVPWENLLAIKETAENLSKKV